MVEMPGECGDDALWSSESTSTSPEAELTVQPGRRKRGRENRRDLMLRESTSTSPEAEPYGDDDDAVRCDAGAEAEAEAEADRWNAMPARLTTG